MIKYCWVFVFLCACSKSAPVPDFPEPPPVPTYQWVAQERVFGFYNQYRYSYCPSVVKDGSGFTHMFFCGNPEQTIMVDNIYHVKWQEGQALTEAKSVLQPGVLGSWDDHHTCDPSIVQGDFSMGGEKYTYAMFYLTNPFPPTIMKWAWLFPIAWMGIPGLSIQSKLLLNPGPMKEMNYCLMGGNPGE